MDGDEVNEVVETESDETPEPEPTAKPKKAKPKKPKARRPKVAEKKPKRTQPEGRMVRISDECSAKLFKMKGKIMTETGEEPTFSDVIEKVLDGVIRK
jgi:hypothetical protein